MTDDEITSLAGAVKSLLDQRDVALRTELAAARADVEALRGDLQLEKALAAEHRKAEAASRTRLFVQIADSIGEAVSPRLQQLQQRTAALEQRGMAPGATQ